MTAISNRWLKLKEDIQAATDLPLWQNIELPQEEVKSKPK